MRDELIRFLTISFLVIASVFLFFHGMALARGVLAPIFLAVILAMMLVPVCHFLEKKGIKKGLAALFSDFIFIFFILGVLWAVGMEVQKMTSQWSSIQDRLSSKFNQVESFIERNSGFSVENPFTDGFIQQGSQEGAQQLQNQPEQVDKREKGSDGEQNKKGSQSGEFKVESENQGNQQATSSGKGNNGGGQAFSVKSLLTTALSKISSSLTTILLITVYIFFMLLYRSKFRKAVLKFIPEKHQEEGKKILSGIIKEARQYLVGNMILVALLTVIYSIGFSLSGMGSPFTTAFLAAVLSLIPYVGTLLGGIIAAGLAFITTGKLSTVWIVLGTYVVAQFIESYFIEPYLVGKRVKVNPLFTILSVTIGAAIWGIIGMIVFLPLFSFIKVVADHVPMLNPLGYAIGNEDTSEKE